jgi:hypothetical protein
VAEDEDALNELRSVSKIETRHLVEHYLYFPSEAAARKVAAILRDRGFEVEVRLGADDVNWLALARSRVVPTDEVIAELRRTFEEIANENGGEYDGWEAEVHRYAE